MSTDAHCVTVSGVRVEVSRKAIKHLHLGVYPPNGEVRMAVPLAVSDDAVRIAVIEKLGWIRRQQAAFAEQERELPREMVSGESHYFLGRRYLLDVIEAPGTASVRLRGRRRMELRVPRGSDEEKRERVLRRWYRARLLEQVPPLLQKWQAVLDVEAASWRVKKMKTKWGSCNAAAKRIWLNSELVKKPPECLEYVIVHELAHLLVRHHDERFVGLLDRHLPKWKHARRLLNAAPLADDRWKR